MARIEPVGPSLVEEEELWEVEVLLYRGLVSQSRGLVRRKSCGRSRSCASAGTQFTCFTSTKVQILTTCASASIDGTTSARVL